MSASAELSAQPGAGAAPSPGDVGSGASSFSERITLVLLVVIGVLNLGVFCRVVAWLIVPSPRYPLYLLWFSLVAVAAAIAYFRGRAQSPTGARLRILLVAAFAAPLCLLLAWHFFAGALAVPLSGLHKLFPSWRGFEMVISYVIAPSLGAYYALPTIGVPYVAATTGFLVFAFRHRTFRAYRWWMALFTVVTFCFVAYLVRWYITGQEFGYL